MTKILILDRIDTVTALDTHSNVHKLVVTAMLITMASVLHILEGWLAPLPHGFKLGLANIITLTAIIWLGPRTAFTVVVGRTMLGSLFTTGIVSPRFAMSFAGAVLSWAVMTLLLSKAKKHFSLMSISVFGSIAHIVAQLLVASLILEDTSIFVLAPLMLFFAVPTGIMVGLVAGFLLRSLARIPAFKSR